MTTAWRGSKTQLVGEARPHHDQFAAECLGPGEEVLIAATHTFFILGFKEFASGPVFVTEDRIIGGQEKLLGKKFKVSQAKVSDIRSFGGDLMSGVGPMWEWEATGVVNLKVVFRDPLEGERFTSLMSGHFGL